MMISWVPEAHFPAAISLPFRGTEPAEGVIPGTEPASLARSGFS